MIIEKNDKFYNVDKDYTQEEITQNINDIQEHINMLQQIINTITFIDTSNLSGDLLTISIQENENRKLKKEDLEAEIMVYQEELIKWQ